MKYVLLTVIFVGSFLQSLYAEGVGNRIRELIDNGSPYQLIVLVAPKNLCYDTAETFFSSLEKQGSSPTVGHAWVILAGKNSKGILDWIEGGHSGEFGQIAPRYLERLVGESQNPDIANPVQVLYEPLHDGIFELGCGGHVPSYSVSFSLTEMGYREIQSLLRSDSGEYPFHSWSLIDVNCVRFVLTCLGRIGIVLDASCVVQVPSTICIRGIPVRMWNDSSFSRITLETPEKLETELRKAVRLGIAREVCVYDK